jgi:hypothetical protein
MTDHCWVEVWNYELTNRRKCGYVNSTSSLYDQLHQFFPFEQWDEIYTCTPGVLNTRITLYKPNNYDNVIPKAKIDNYSYTMFKLPDRGQLVIIEKINPYEVDASRVAQRSTGQQRFRPY